MDDLQQQIVALAQWWIPRMSIPEFNIGIRFDEVDNAATAEGEPRYLQHTVNFNLPKIEWRIAHEGTFDLEEYVVHELAHAYTIRPWALAEKLLGGKDMQHAWIWVLEEIYEEATTRIANTLIELKRSLEDENRKA
jgi:hypothetical protein